MYKSMNTRFDCNRRDFVKAGGIVTAGVVLGTPALWAQEKYESGQPERAKTNIDERSGELERSFHIVRQQGITEEMLEIASGAQALGSTAYPSL